MADDVVTAAPEEAIYLLGRALLRPEDRVIVTYPGYQSLYEIATSVGARVERWTPEETAEGWWFDPERLEALAKDGARAIVVNFPHNPTGALPSRAEWARVIATAERAGALLVSDEMYRGLEYDEERRLAPGGRGHRAGRVDRRGCPRRTGCRAFASAGWRRATALCCEAVQAYKDYTTICASAPSERLAVVALKNAPRLVGRCREIVAANRPPARGVPRRVRRSASPWRPPLAGPIAFARFHPGDASAFCERLALAAGVMLLPSSVFEWGDSHVRFGFGRTSLPGSPRRARAVAHISLRGLGRPKKKPWACVKPMRMHTSASSAVSTPSATV